METYDSPEILSVINNLPGAIGYKNTDSSYIGGNQLLASYMGYQHPGDIVGVKDTDIRSEMSALAEDYINQDAAVLVDGEQQHLDIGHYPDGELQVHFSVKKKLFSNNNELIGTVFNCIELQPLMLKGIYEHIVKSSGAGFYAIGGQYKAYQLARRESQTLFYLIRGFTAKEVGIKLGLSPKTIEYHIEQLKIKLDCRRRSHLIEKAIHLGFFFNIPIGFI